MRVEEIESEYISRVARNLKVTKLPVVEGSWQESSFTACRETNLYCNLLINIRFEFVNICMILTGLPQSHNESNRAYIARVLRVVQDQEILQDLMIFVTTYLSEEIKFNLKSR